MRELDVSTSEDIETVFALERIYQVPDSRRAVPTVFIGDTFMVGGGEIPAKLPNKIAEYMQSGGVKCILDEGAEEEIEMPAPAVARVMLFYAPDDAGSTEIRENLLPRLQNKYGDNLEVWELDVSDPVHAQLKSNLDERMGIPEAQRRVPEVYIHNSVLVGASNIEKLLVQEIDAAIERGGNEYTFPPDELENIEVATSPTSESEPTAPPTAAPAETESDNPPIYLAYFSKVGCEECNRTHYELNYFQEKYPQLEVREFKIENKEARLLAEALAIKYGLPDELHLGTPAVFIGEDYYVDTETTRENIQASIEKNLDSGTGKPWEKAEPYLDEARANITDRFQTFSALAIFGVGLIDGVNPCAFATMVFFISYLSIVGRKGREIIYVGAAFALAIFISYLAIGVGLFNFVLRFVSPTASRILTIAIAGLSIVLGILSLRDAYMIRQGKSNEMTLKVPHNLRMLINKVVRTQARTQNYIVGAFVAGLAISVLEAVCTGQTYLPTITAVLANASLRARAYLLLILYNLGFIVPLVVVFLLAYRGATSQSLSKLIEKRGAVVKLVIGFFFFGLAGFLFYSL